MTVEATIDVVMTEDAVIMDAWITIGIVMDVAHELAAVVVVEIVMLVVVATKDANEVVIDTSRAIDVNVVSNAEIAVQLSVHHVASVAAIVVWIVKNEVVIVAWRDETAMITMVIATEWPSEVHTVEANRAHIPRIAHRVRAATTTTRTTT